MRKVWHKPEIQEQDIGLEVTGYQSADIDVVT
jgi:coenzyme PQQ precursor peptide PqqA